MSGQVTIEVDLGPLADEWEVIAIRSVRVGDQYVSRCTSTVCKAQGAYDDPHIIVRRHWKWPAGLTCAAIAMDADGKWWAYETRPTLSGDEWRCVGGYVDLRDWQIDLPDVDDYRESLRLNPHREKST